MSDSDDDQAGVPLIEDISSSENEQSTKKRKRSNEDAAEEKKAARKKKRTLKKPKDIDDEHLDDKLGVNHAIAHMDSRLLVDHLAQRTKRFKPELSVVELEDMYIPGKSSYLKVCETVPKKLDDQRKLSRTRQAMKSLARPTIWRHSSSDLQHRGEPTPKERRSCPMLLQRTVTHIRWSWQDQGYVLQTSREH
jgi:hypothetical protein